MQGKRFSFCLLLLCFFLLFPAQRAQAISSDAYHSLFENAASIGAKPTDPLTSRMVSSFLDCDLGDSEQPLSLGELCGRIRSYLHSRELVLPRLRENTPFCVLPHGEDILYCYQGGILGELPENDRQVTVAEGCLILSRLLSHAQPPDHRQPVSSLAEDDSADISTLEEALMMGHSNAVGMYIMVQSPLSYAARDALSTYDYLRSDDLLLPMGCVGRALDALQMRSFKTVYIMLGTNDCTWGFGGLEDYRSQLSNIIGLVRYFQGDAKVCLIGISPIGFDALGIQETFRQDVIRAYNQVQKSLSRDYGVAYLDIFTLLANEEGYNRPEITRNDGLHYLPEGYELLLKELYTHPVN